MKRPSKKTVIGSIVLLIIGIGIGANGKQEQSTRVVATTVTETSTVTVSESPKVDPTQNASTPKREPEAATKEATAKLPEGCLPVGQQLIDRLQLPAMMEHGQIEVTKAVAAKGVDNYFIAASTTFDGSDGETPMIFAASSIEGQGSQIYTASRLAEGMTRWPDSGVNPINSPGAAAAERCLEGIG